MKKTAFYQPLIMSVCILLLFYPRQLFSAGTAGTAGITVEEYVSLVEKNSKQLMIALRDVDIAKSTEKAVRAQALPMIGAEAGYTRNLLEVKQPVPVGADVPAGGGFTPLTYQDMKVVPDNDFSFGLSLNQQIFNLKVFNAIKASREYLLMTNSIYEIQNQAVITIAKKVFYQNFLIEQLLEAKKTTEQNAYENYLNIKEKHENGLVSRFELLRSEVDWKMKIPETTQAQKNLDIARLNFKNLAGMDPEENITIICDINQYPAIPEVYPLPKILENRPDFETLTRELRLRDINIKAAKADHYPTVSGNILYAFSAGSDGFSLDNNNTTITQVGIKVSLPLFTGGALTAMDRKAGAEHEQTKIKLARLTQDIMTEINTIYLSLKEAYERIQSASGTFKIAETAYEIARTSYSSGLATQMDLKDASLSLELARINHISAVYEYLSSYFDWEQALGKAGRNVPVQN